MQDLVWLDAALGGVLGLLLGSFLNVWCTACRS